MPAKQNLIGHRYGRLTVVEELKEKQTRNGVSKKVFWRCKCDCGGEVVTTSGVLKYTTRCKSCPTNDAKEEFLNKQFESKSFGPFIVTKYVSTTEVHIKFINTGYESVVAAKEVRLGKVKDYLVPNVAGHGYIGIGEHLATVNGKSSKEYEVWCGILKRAYNVEWRKSTGNENYSDVTVCGEWHNFQNFAKWYKENTKDLPEGIYEVDKDLKIVGNRHYSPSTCSIVPGLVNTLFTGTKDDRDLPRGIHFDKHSQKYIAQIHRGETTKTGKMKQSYLGRYSNKDDAIEAYRKAKIEQCRLLAQRYENILDRDVYLNLTQNVLAFI